MLNKLLAPFGFQSIHKIINNFYELFKLSLIFTLFNIPWIVLNIAFKFTPVTGIIYGIVSLILYPNIKALFYGMHRVLNFADQYTFIQYIKIFLTTWRQLTAKFCWYSVGINSVLSIYFIEFSLIIKSPALKFMIIPFIIIGIFMMATFVLFLLITAINDGTEEMGTMLKLAVFLSWRNLFSAMILALLLMLWLSLGYYAPIVNLLFGNELVFWLVYKFLYLRISRLIQRDKN
ncbi:hypothetical protein [Lapidilactobacillus wuchangensis]|uniref:hypothetical protein n=1 Tax=Lapidilactobacillus wuchangensis TaxID=2486001 RepID=UPI000F7A2251|nr:hypothetical protein [Lapidilactobacillus wuchangensis]